MRKPLPENALKLFRLYAEDAGNWGGMPLVNGNVTLLGEKEDRGLLTHLKRAGLITTIADKNRINGRIVTHAFVDFTEAGKAFAASLGIEITE
jgi:hypothetical protein